MADQAAIEAAERKLRISLEERAERLSAYEFKQRQMKLFPNALQLYEPQTFTQLYQSELQNSARDADIIAGIVIQFFIQLGYSDASARSIVGKLPPNVRLYMSDAQQGFLNAFRRQFPRVLPAAETAAAWTLKYIHENFTQPRPKSYDEYERTKVKEVADVTPVTEMTAAPPVTVSFSDLPFHVAADADPGSMSPLLRPTVAREDNSYAGRAYRWLAQNKNELLAVSTRIRESDFKPLFINKKNDNLSITQRAIMAKGNEVLLHHAMKFLSDLAVPVPAEFLDVEAEEGKEEVTGFGFSRRRRRFRGGGVGDPALNAHQYNSIGREGKFSLDLTKLGQGVLAVKYGQGRGHYKVRPVALSKDGCAMVLDVVKGDFNRRLFELLPESDRRAIQSFVTACAIPADLPNDDVHELYKQYEICKGEVLAGSDSKQVIQQLKQLTFQLLKLKRITRGDAFDIFVYLSSL